MMLDISLGFFTQVKKVKTHSWVNASALTISANFQSDHHKGNRSYLLLHEPPVMLFMTHMGLIFEGEMAL